MDIFRKISRVRVLFLAAGQAVALTAGRAGFSPGGCFRADVPGREALGRWLRASPDFPLYLVADLAGEEFHRETVPHVRWGGGRKALLERRLSRLFPDTLYRCARVQGREKAGRRDDRVLFSALPDNEQLAPWLETILESGAPLAGITSVPMLGEKLAALRHGDVHPLLLVIQLQGVGLRQNCLVDGRLRFSRLVPGFEEGQGAGLRAAFLEECERTRQYLVREKLILPEQMLEIHLYAEAARYGGGVADDPGPPFLRLHIHDAAALLRQQGMAEDKGCPAIFLLCLLAARRSRGLVNHYAPPTLLRRHRLRGFSRGMAFSAGILAILSCLGAYFLHREGNVLAARQQGLRVRTEALLERHDALRQNFPTADLAAVELRQTVEFIDALSGVPSPVAMMRDVGLVLAECPEIRLHRFAWQMSAALPETEAGLAGTEIPDAGEAAEPALLLAAAAEGRSGISVFLAGSVLSASGHRAACLSVRRFAALLESRSGFSVTPVRMPMEPGPGAGLQASLAEGPQTPAFFVLRLAGGQEP